MLLSNLVITVMLWDVRHYSHFVDEETEAEKDLKTLVQDHTAKWQSFVCPNQVCLTLKSIFL